MWNLRDKLAENKSLNAYLFTLTKNRCIDVVRRERLYSQFHKSKVEDDNYLTESIHALNDPILNVIFEQEFQSEIDRVVDHLSDQCRRVYNLSRCKGLKNKEIGEELNISQKTVESHQSKALAAIRKAL